jgi:excinuclease ABC subunit C
MELAAKKQEYESAAMFRDQINALKQMQAQQFVAAGRGDIDFIALAQEQSKSCVQLVSFRGGRNLGQRSHFPSQAEGHEAGEILEAFLGQYYQERLAPAQLVLSHAVESRELLSQVFTEKAGRKVTIQAHPRGDRRHMLELASANALQVLKMRLASRANLSKQFEAFQQLIGLDEIPDSVDCFDISHTAGEQTVGSCVVFDIDGPVKSKYRRYNLKGIKPGDDYAAMKQVLSRRYSRLQKEDGHLPGLILVDGGKGQLKQALEVLGEYGLSGIPVMGVAKGRPRRAGYEEWILPQPMRSYQPGPESPASHLVQQIRDEAHRFAITGHRGRRHKIATRSTLEKIPGIGPKRRRSLLNHFGGLQGVNKAGIEELSSVPGVSRLLAEQIFRALH